MKSLVIYFTFCISSSLSFAQVKLDDEESKKWPSGFYKIEIVSSKDSTLQPSILYKSSKPGRPLIVSLHSWSGDYTQEDSISWEIKERDWNYIHPNFRGPNWTPEACGSNLVIDDIEDAINYAIKVTGANPNEVHVVGTSGGGHATMLCYMKLPHPVKSFSAWVGISNLEDWYFESVGRNQQYAKDILKATGDTIQLNVAEARMRSPFYAPTPVRNSKLYLYAGIHDGYLGSIPVTQTLKFYNKIVRDLHPGDKESLVSAEDMIEILSKRNYQLKDFRMHIGDRTLHYYKKKNNISVSIFEGKHEQIVKSAIALLPVNTSVPDTIFNILCIGDSNGELPGGWPVQLRYLLPFSNILNKCKSGNTIGFDNNGDTGLNELKNINNHLIQASGAVSVKPFDYIIIMLGTNDCKAILNSNSPQITKNMDILLRKIKGSGISYKKIILVSPPPVTVAANTHEKYRGALNKLSSLRKLFENLSKIHRCDFVDAYSLFESDFSEYTTDGVHLTTLAQQKLARILTEAIAN